MGCGQQDCYPSLNVLHEPPVLVWGRSVCLGPGRRKPKAVISVGSCSMAWCWVCSMSRSAWDAGIQSMVYGVYTRQTLRIWTSLEKLLVWELGCAGPSDRQGLSTSGSGDRKTWMDTAIKDAGLASRRLRPYHECGFNVIDALTLAILL